MQESINFNQLQTDYQALILSHQTVQLATTNAKGEADISYAPYVKLDNAFYVYVSNLAAHTANMLRNKQVAIMFIQPETAATNPFARQRLIYNCLVQEIGKDTEQYKQLLDIMHARFGEIVSVLRSLPDFHLLALNPQHGQYVAGFGKAFRVDAASGKLTPFDR
jgi:putative heme iron utilization protein